MRVLAVRGCNLASLDGPFAVELDQGALNRAGLFAITGPTGAGKSTILDALCLALFDRMPRLPDGRGVALGKDGGTDAILTTDVRTILRRGAGAGWAEVDFIGIDGAAYRARWELRRARQNARGQLQKQSMSLSSLDGSKRFGDGKTSVLEEISTRLGLSFEQFRRAVLLAQGDFANFLKAPAKERSALLELLTGTEIYSRLSVAAHQRCDAEKRALDALEAQCAGIGVLSDEDRASLEVEAGALAAEVQAREAALEVARASVAWHERDAQLAASEHAARRRAEEAETLWSAAEPRRTEAALVRSLDPVRPLLAEAERCARESAEALDALTRARTAETEARQHLELAIGQHAQARRAFEASCTDQAEAEPELERAAVLDAQIAPLAARVEQARGDLAAVQRRVADLTAAWTEGQAALVAARREVAEREEWLARHAAFAPVVEQWARWDALLTRHGDESRNRRTAEDRCARSAAEVRVQDEALARLADERTGAAAALAMADAALAAVQAEPVQPLVAISRRRTALTGRRDSLSALARLAEQATRLALDIATAEDLRARQRDAAERASGNADDTRTALDRQRAVLEEAEATLRRLHLAHRQDVGSLRAQLADGEPCPVCGACEHPYAAGGTPLAGVTQEQDQRVADLRAEVTGLARNHGAFEAAATSAREQEAAQAARLAALHRERAECAARWTALRADILEWSAPEGSGDPNGDLPEEPSADGAAALLAGTEAELAEVGRAEAMALDHKARLDTAERVRRDREAAVSEALRLIDERTRLRGEARHAEELARGDRDRAARAMTAVAEELAAPLAVREGWAGALETDAEALRGELAERVAEHRAHGEASTRALATADRLDRESTARTFELDAARQAEGAAQGTAADLGAELRAHREARGRLLGGRAVAEVKTALANARHRSEALVEKATVTRQDAASRLSAAEQEHATRAESSRRCVDAAARAAAALAQATDRCGLSVDEARTALARGEDWLAAEEKALSALDTARREAGLLADERARQRAEHREGATPDATAQEAEAAVAETAQALRALRDQQGERLARLRADAENRGRLAAVLDRVAAQRKTHALWAAMGQLIGSADGRKLRNFAQSLSLDLLLVQANRYLTDLARRYRLERVEGADLEIQVVDGEMGDERRGVHSLSGGEMFLVSLALALGLSAMAGGTGSGIGTLFIDEGFGTLDPDSLDLALSCLEALQASGRQVGVISHVPALVERIGVQVRVMPLGGGRSAVSIAQGGLTVAGTATAAGEEVLLPL